MSRQASARRGHAIETATDAIACKGHHGTIAYTASRVKTSRATASVRARSRPRSTSGRGIAAP
jgi:hypothetical protein